MNPARSKLTALLSSASLLTMAGSIAAKGQEPPSAIALPQEPPETVLITGSLIPGTVPVGVTVNKLGLQNFSITGALTTSDLFRTIPAANVSPGPVAVNSGANTTRGTRVNLRGLDTGTATRSLLLVDGVRIPGQGDGLCMLDPGIIPAIAQQRIDILVDGGSATYGSDAIGGVINIILRRGYDGAISQVRYTTAEGGKNRYLVSQLWGRSWDGGNVTLSYEWYDQSPVRGTAHSNFTTDFSPWGLDNRIPLASSLPGTISTGAPAPAGGTLPAARGANCTNCFAIPNGTGADWSAGASGLGPLAPFSASTLNWSSFAVGANSGTNGTRNEFNPYSLAWEDAADQRNGSHFAIDQRLTNDISFFGTGFYSNRRAQFLNPSNLFPSSNNDLVMPVPTVNPYYPSGGAPANLRVSYNIGVENPSPTSAYELAARYQFGLNFALPGDWGGKLFYARTYDSNSFVVSGSVNPRAVSAALGWTVAAFAGSGTFPSLGTWTKPASVPYLNLFCDPTQFHCNSGATLAYISGVNAHHEVMQIDDKTAILDGPLFDLPGGQAKAAIGAQYETQSFFLSVNNTTSSQSLLAPVLLDGRGRHVWAVFAQVNAPILSEVNAVPFIDRLEIEASWRHDQYSDFGGTSNPRLALNWEPLQTLGLTFRGAWGTSFRAPGFGELTSPFNAAINCLNVPSQPNCVPQTISTGLAGIVPPVGSGAFKVNPTGAASLISPVGLSVGGYGAAIAAGLRAPGTLNQGNNVLGPEQSMNWSLGFEFAPSNVLKGLNIQASWYKIKITSVLQAFNDPNSFTDPSRGFAFLVPSDFANVPGNANCASANAAPTTCPAFENAVLSLLTNSQSTVDRSLASQVLWINDGGLFNRGWLTTEGVDWNASYDWDVGDLGQVDAGIDGTYYLHRLGQNVTEPVQDGFHTTLNAGQVNEARGVESLPRMRYRARLGWTEGSWNITGFMDYQSHYFHNQAAPPNVNGQCTVAGGSLGGGTLPCAINTYLNIEPSFYTFDLSLGYDTGDNPANEYLRRIGIQLVVQNVFARHAPFEYRIGAGGGNPAAYDILKPNYGRQISFILTKTW